MKDQLCPEWEHDGTKCTCMFGSVYPSEKYNVTVKTINDCGESEYWWVEDTNMIGKLNKSTEFSIRDINRFQAKVRRTFKNYLIALLALSIRRFLKLIIFNN